MILEILTDANIQIKLGIVVTELYQMQNVIHFFFVKFLIKIYQDQKYRKVE